MRQFDDKIIYMLNTTLPTESFKSQNDPTVRCKDLFEKIQSSNKTREFAITRCLNTSREKIQELKNEKDKGDDSPQLHKILRKEQNTLRLLQSELNVEEVVKKRTADVYHQRCRGYYKPPQDI